MLGRMVLILLIAIIACDVVPNIEDSDDKTYDTTLDTDMAGDSHADGDGDGDADGDADEDTETDPLFMGCRSPMEEGCLQCCLYADDSGDSDGSDDCTLYTQFTEAIQYYVQVENPCPDICPPCASCFESEEADFRSLLNRAAEASCECEGLVIGNDPCDPSFNQTDCECICAPYEQFVKECGTPPV